MMRRPTKAKAIERLRKARNAIPRLKQLQYDSQEFNKWRRDTRTAIANTFPESNGHVEEFKTITFYLSKPLVAGAYTRNEHQAAYERGLEGADSLLASMTDEVNEYWIDEDHSHSSHAHKIEPPITSEVFIVHGRDAGSASTLARFLEKLDLQPIVLAEQPSQGLTIIEKFERHAQVAFAIVLLTPDDTGSLQGTDNAPNPRARQNVIFELGFFIGKLGRDRVCALTKGDIEIPSDYSGVVYVELDESEGWKLPLARELRKAGLAVDVNQAL